MRHSHQLFGSLVGLGFCLFVLALLALWVIVAIKLAKAQGRPGPVPGFFGAPTLPPHDADSSEAMRLLNERLAKGEIEIDDYYQRRSALKGPDPRRPETPPPGGGTD